MAADRPAPAPAGVTKHLTAVRFPCDRDGLLAAARTAGAPDPVLRILRHIENRAYEGMAQVSEEVARLRLEEGERLERVEEASQESFPASDAPGFGPPSGVGRPPRH